jgi:hypothetical protein
MGNHPLSFKVSLRAKRSNPVVSKWRDCFVAVLLAMTAQAWSAVPDGYVVRVDSATVYLDWGTASGVQSGDRFSLYREGEPLKHPVTGEILGHAQEKLGTGALQSIEEKFTVGQLEIVSKTPQAGDRAHWLASAITLEPTASTTTPAADQGTVLTPAEASLKELWRSDPLEKDAAGITFANLEGDGKKTIIVAYRTKIQAYRLKDKRLEPLASFDLRSYRHWLSVDAADLKHDGHEEIFATTFMDGLKRPRVVVLRFENGAFKQMGEFEGFVRVIQRLDGSRHLYWQSFSHSRELSYTAVSEVTWEKGAYRTGPPLDLKLFDDQLFGFVWGDWDKDGKEDFAVLEHDEQVRIYTKDVKWKSSSGFGGTKNDFSFDDNTLSSLVPRLVNWKPSQGDRDQLIVPHNIPELGIRLTYLKIYKQSELQGLIWNGLELQPAWRLAIQGYLADFGIVELLGEPRPQLWVAAVGPGDKTVLLSYNLP